MYFNKYSLVQEALENFEVKKNTYQTFEKNKFEALDTKPLTNTNKDESRSNQEYNNGVIHQ